MTAITKIETAGRIYNPGEHLEKLPEGIEKWLIENGHAKAEPKKRGKRNDVQGSSKR